MNLKKSSKASKSEQAGSLPRSSEGSAVSPVEVAPAGDAGKPTGLRNAARVQNEDAYDACRASLARVFPEVGVFVNYGDGCFVPHGGVQLKRTGDNTVEMVDLMKADGIYFLKEGTADISDFVEPDGSLNHYGKGVLSSFGYGRDGQVVNCPDGTKESWRIDLDSVRIQALEPAVRDRIVADLFAGLASYNSEWVSEERTFGGQKDVDRWVKEHPLNGASRLEDVMTVLTGKQPTRGDVAGFRGEHSFDRWVDERLEEALAVKGLSGCARLAPEAVEGWLVQSAYEKRWAEKVAVLHSRLPALANAPLVGPMSLDASDAADARIGECLVDLAEQAAREGWVFDSDDLGGRAIESVREACPWVGLRSENGVNLSPDRWDWIGQVVAPVVSASMAFRGMEVHDGPLGTLDAALVKGAPVVWTGRAVYHRGLPFDLVVDRQTVGLAYGAHSAQKDALLGWLQASGLDLLQKAVLAARLDPAEDKAVQVEEWPFLAQASPKGSHGHLYVQAFMQDTLQGRDRCEGRWAGFGPVPEIGQVVDVPGNEVGPSTVIGYRLVDGGDDDYLGLVVKPRSEPRWLRNQREEDGGSGVLIVFGPEIRKPTWP